MCPLSSEHPYRLVTINFLSWSKEPDLREIVQFPPVCTLFCKLGVESTGSVDLSCADIGSLCSATPLLQPWSEGFLDLSRHQFHHCPPMFAPPKPPFPCKVTVTGCRDQAWTSLRLLFCLPLSRHSIVLSQESCIVLHPISYSHLLSLVTGSQSDFLKV